MEGGRRLTDHRGCGLGEVATSWCSVSGVRQLSARLQVPAVQGGRVLVTCRVVACRGPCPAQPCRGEEVVQGQLQGGITLQVEARVCRGEEEEVHTGAHRHREGEGLLEQLQVTIKIGRLHFTSLTYCRVLTPGCASLPPGSCWPSGCCC